MGGRGSNYTKVVIIGVMLALLSSRLHETGWVNFLRPVERCGLCLVSAVALVYHPTAIAFKLQSSYVIKTVTNGVATAKDVATAGLVFIAHWQAYV